MVTILGRQDGEARNHSEIKILDLAKWREKPAGLEEIDGYRLHVTPDETYTMRCYQFPWSTRRDCLDWLSGYSTTAFDVSEFSKADDQAALDSWLAYFADAVPPGPPPADKVTWRLSRSIPAQDPERPWLFVSEIDVTENAGAWVEDPAAFVLDDEGNEVEDLAVESDPDNPFDGASLRTGEIAYASTDTGDRTTAHDGMMRVRVTYRARNYAVLSDTALAARPNNPGELGRFVERDERYSIEALPLAKLAAGQKAQLKYTTPPDGAKADGSDDPGTLAGRVVPEAGVKLMPSAVLTYRWYGVPDRPLVNYARCIGKINAAPFDGVGGAPLYPPGTLLCQPWETRRVTGPTGWVCWNITCHFFFRPRGWNFSPTAGGKFLYATFTDQTGGDPDGAPVYESASFNLLFQVPPPVKYT